MSTSEKSHIMDNDGGEEESCPSSDKKSLSGLLGGKDKPSNGIQRAFKRIRSTWLFDVILNRPKPMNQAVILKDKVLLLATGEEESCSSSDKKIPLRTFEGQR